MNRKNVAYWVCTAVTAFVFLSGGVVYVLRVPEAVQGVMNLGFPLHFIVFLGIWKFLGGLVVLLPGLPLVKEWAYAGMIFDLTGAAVASAATGIEVRHVWVPLLIACVVVASWALRPESRRLKRT
jgi:hypothetical protein